LSIITCRISASLGPPPVIRPSIANAIPAIITELPIAILPLAISASAPPFLSIALVSPNKAPAGEWSDTYFTMLTGVLKNGTNQRIIGTRAALPIVFPY